MSDAKAENLSSMPNNAVGRNQSRARRQAMSRGGKAAEGTTAKAKFDQRRTAPTRVEPRLPAIPVHEEKKAEQSSTEQRARTHASEAQVLEEVCSAIDSDPESSSSVRQLCQERRRALSSQGKTARAVGRPGSSNRHQRQDNRKDAGLKGRAAAQARRDDLCRNGRGDNPACRPTGRVRTQAATPAKVEEGSTLRGTLVTGTQVERTNKITGIEAGSCRAITGTEYIGAEQYQGFCSTIPGSAAPKVGVGSTRRGQRVSGTEVGHSVLITGNEHGSCKNVTGNDYISADQFESYCGSKAMPGAAKIGITETQSGQRVSGTELGLGSKMTGNESGATFMLTGTQYQSGTLDKNRAAPHKVSVMSTVHERPVTGTDVAASATVTGSEYGACQSITGTEYLGLAQYQACNREPVSTPEKVIQSRTWRDQSVSGSSVEHNAKVTGDEYGGCQPISGTEYIGPDQYASLCDAEGVAASRERVATRRGPAGASMTGLSQNATSKVTGKARGNAQPLSGTPYSDDAQNAMRERSQSNRHPLAQGPADRSAPVLSGDSVAASGNFSVMSPARSAQESQLNRVTGTAASAQSRITGPVNLAAGLVSGTPEFRYREDNFSEPPVAAKSVQAEASRPNRVTGEGREAGFAITGAAWRRGDGVTGTEGTSAMRRNPTLRGDSRGMAMQAPAMKDREAVQVPPSKVTGSSGNATSGSTITYSGGARG